MNRIKRTGALLVAIALILGVVLQSGIRGVFAVNSEQGGEQTTQVTQPVTEAVTEPITEPVTEPITEAVTEPVTEPAAEAVTEPTTAPDGEAQTTEPTSEADVTTDVTTDTTTDVTTEDSSENSGDNSEDVLPEINIYQQLMSCGSLAEMEALLFAEENAAAVAMLTQEERILISARIEEICAQTAQLTESEIILKDRLLAKLNENIIAICPECGGVGTAHNDGCSAFVPVCTCGGLDGVHAEDCPAYVPVCTCGGLDGTHAEDCPAYVPVCICGSTDGTHAEDCPAYVAEDEVYIWSEFTDFELAMWLMDESNTETVKAILADETTEEYAELTLRIDAILGGEDAVLAEQLMAYLTALAEMDGAETLAADDYIYFDLAAGNVTIGASTYSGFVYVKDLVDPQPVTGTHDNTNKYYIYQSTVTNRDTTGYPSKTAYINKSGCIVPKYPRVTINDNGVTKNWTDYITNNIDVYEVSKNWDKAAKEPSIGRTSTDHYITFASESNYTADVIIDNIWTTYQEYRNTWRTTGGIGASLNYWDNINKKGYTYTNVNIFLHMKGDNRVSCVHYSSGEGNGNSINFINGDIDANPGSITVADFPEKWYGNYWNAVIGGADNLASFSDKSDGIVIESGYIYAGATFEDNCTAIGGGGNDYGGVTIKGGTVTAVTGGTGTAIGGGIGYSNQGGDTDVLITGGTIYAYNLGLKTGVDDNFTKFVPSAAIGGGGSKYQAGGLTANITIEGGTVYAQSMGGPGIGGGGSAESSGGPANITITGGTIIAKSVGGSYKNEDILPGVSIGGGTGATGGGSVELNISGTNTTIRTGSIGGGKGTNTGAPLGSANVTIAGGDITGQVIMMGGAKSNCTFTMTDGKIHGSNVVEGYTISDIEGFANTKIEFIEKNGGAVWMQDPNGVTTISGGTIEGCTAYNGGAVYMTGGTFELSKTATIAGNTATNAVPDGQTDPGEKGLGGAVYISGGDVNINGGTIGETAKPNIAVDGAGVYVKGGTVTVNNGNVQHNKASGNGGGIYVTKSGETAGKVIVTGGSINNNTAQNGGGVYLPNGEFSMTCNNHHEAVIHGGVISDNRAEKDGGGIYLTTDPTLKEGIIRNNTAKENGGGVCVSGGELVLDSDQMQIYGNTATNGGGAAVLGGNFKLNGGAVGITGETPAPVANLSVPEPSENDPPIDPDAPPDPLPGDDPLPDIDDPLPDIDDPIAEDDPVIDPKANSATNGGGVYVSGGNVNILGGNIWHNHATKGGGVYLANGEGNFTLNGETAVISSNTAQNGAGVYLYKPPIINKGRIERNTATENGGGMYIYDCKVELYPDGEVYIAYNSAKNGAGIYIHGKNEGSGSSGDTTGVTDPSGVPVDAVSSASPPDQVGLRVQESTIGHIYFTNNTATVSGGAVCIDIGRFYLNTGNATIAENKAENCGGVAVLNGNFTMTAGSIGENGKPNNATNGGGVYVSNGEVYLWGGIVEYNTAENGGGAYVSATDGGAGNLNISGGSILHNSASKNGGGAYVHGTGASIGKLNFASGTISQNTANENGGGFYVNDGNFEMGRKASGGAAPAEPPAETPVETTAATSTVAPAETTTQTSADTPADPPAAASDEAIISGNTASGNGGGGYVAGDFLMISGTIGGTSGANTATNGGGIYVSDGNVDIVYGDIEGNIASESGGGFYVSAYNEEVAVLMLSGNLSNNQAGVNGGGMAVDSIQSKTITVKIGCLLHHVFSGNGDLTPIEYIDGYLQYGQYSEHESCPQVKNNTAKNIGGGFYMNSAASTLYFHCVEEANNIAEAKESSEGMDVEGGKVVIGDDIYHNYEHDVKQGNNKIGAPRGYIVMDNATVVNGGQVDIYGDMTNPIFKDEVTVDIEDTNDHFLDHRRKTMNETRYKVHYIENFFGTGLYQAYQYDESTKVITIPGALYNRPGYTILGWYTKAEQKPEDDKKEHKFYKVGEQYDLSRSDQVPQMGIHSIDCEFCGKDVEDKNLLELYAIWKANGYIVRFDPNVPEGASYTGTMDDQVFNYGKEDDVKKPLSGNAFKCQGYNFINWNTNPDGTGTSYSDKYEVANLTDKDGAVIVLYAQWKKCDHKDSEKWSYSLENGDKTLRRDCSCGGQTLRATLVASDTVYDGVTHPAALIYDSDEWGTDILNVTYTGNRLPGETIYTSDLELNEGKPYHAGKYTASITKTNKITNVDGTITEQAVIAKIDYTISKADQDAPAKPTYRAPGVDESISSLTVNKLDGDPKTITDLAGKVHSVKAQYRVSYYDGADLKSTAWQECSVDNTISITLPAAYTNYFVEARYKELEDYNASEPTRADAVYFFTGNVQVLVICDNGITHKFTDPSSTDITYNGLNMELTLDEDNYYLVSTDYDVTANLELSSGSTQNCNVEHIVNSGKYKFTGIISNSKLTITIGKTRKTPIITSQVAPGQVFSPFTGNSETISKDSAFTAAFKITNFDPYVAATGVVAEHGAYKDPILKFSTDGTTSTTIPANTTIILVDRKNGSKDYWYYRADSDTSTVNLTDFKKMGGTASDSNYSVPQPAVDNGYVNLDYQFIVDFSQTTGGYTGDKLIMTLEAAAQDPNAKSPEIKENVTVDMADSSFTLTADAADTTADLSNSFVCTFSKGGTASKWEDRSSALVLTPAESNANLPADARIKAAVGSTTTYLNKSDNQFIVPMSLLKSNETVTLTLESALFPKDGETYNFNAQWMVSQSKASKSPINGYQAGTLNNVTFTSAAKAQLSLKPVGDQRVLTTRNTLKLNVKTLNMNGYVVTATLQRKSGNTYSSTGSYQEFKFDESTDHDFELNMSMAGQIAGSFRVMFTVKSSSPESVQSVLEVPYYFVISD